MLWVAIFFALLWLGIACDVVGRHGWRPATRSRTSPGQLNLTGNLHAGRRRRPEHESSSLVATEYLG